MVVSVGTGMSRWKKIPADVKKNNILKWAQQLPDMLMQGRKLAQPVVDAMVL
jgi:hypothetical protein